MTPNMRATMQWLRDHGFMKGTTMADDDFTLDEKTEISSAFSAGDYANAYEGEDLESMLDSNELNEHERAAFVLGFFSSYSLDEIGSDREIFDECYFSKAGRYVVQVARYTDDRGLEYAYEGYRASCEDSGEDPLDEIAWLICREATNA